MVRHPLTLLTLQLPSACDTDMGLPKTNLISSCGALKTRKHKKMLEPVENSKISPRDMVACDLSADYACTNKTQKNETDPGHCHWENSYHKMCGSPRLQLGNSMACLGKFLLIKRDSFINSPSALKSGDSTSVQNKTTSTDQRESIWIHMNQCESIWINVNPYESIDR